MTARYLKGPFPKPRESWSAPVRFRAVEPDGPKSKSVTFTEWQCMECGEVVSDTRGHRPLHDKTMYSPNG